MIFGHDGYIFAALCMILLCLAQSSHATAAAAAAANIDRDIVLTPNETIQLPGKILYFDPNDSIVPETTSIGNVNGNGRQLNINDDDDGDESSAENFDDNNSESNYVPWLEPLKHALYLVLNHKINGNSNKSETISKHILQAAGYHALPNRKIQKFGDIIGMASGRLEINDNGDAAIVELPENCVKLCADAYLTDQNVSGVWSVEKIRHRDENRGHRYELKITIRPMKRNRYDTKRDADGGNGLSKARSFLIKDDDYPQFFLDGRDTDGNSERKSNQRIEKRIFNILYDNTEIPFHLNYGRSPNIPLVYGLGQDSNLNIGEYYMGRPPVSAATASYHQRPSRFTAGPHPPNGLPNQISPSGHMHHHYYLNKDEVPIYKASLFDNGHIFSQHGSHGPLVLPNQVPSLPYSTIRNPQNQPIENQIRPNEFYNSFQPTPSIPIQFPSGDSDAEKYRGGVKGAYDDNRESVLEGEHHKYIVSQFDVQNNNLLNIQPPLPPKPNAGIPTSHGHGITPTPYIYEIDTSSPTPGPISFYSNQPQPQHHHHQQQQQQQQHQHQQFPQLRPPLIQPQLNPNQNHVNPSSVYSSQQLANQLYWFGGHEQPRNPNVQFESSYPFHENTFSELDPVFHGNGQSIPSNGADQPILVTPGNDANVHPTTGFSAHDSNRETSQLPPQHSNHAYTESAEDSSTTQENAEPNYTTPYILTTTKGYGKQRANDGKPDSINAQLPPPDSDDDLTVPYVDASVHTEKPYSPVRLIERPVDRQHVAHSKTEYVTTEKRNDQVELASTDVPNKMEKLFDTDQRTAIQVRYKGDTKAPEKKTVKWTPKRVRQRKPTAEVESERKEYRRRKGTTTTTTSTTATSGNVDDNKPEIITAKSVYFHDEPRTSQSVKKTVSIRIGSDEDEETTVKAAAMTTTTTTSTTKSPATATTPSNTTTNSPESHTFATQNDKPFVPTPIGRSNVTRLAMIRRVDGRIIDSERINAKRTRYNLG